MAKPPRSEAQRAASRANGRRSKGPRTPAGKTRSRRNAMKHGLRAASLDILAGDNDAPPLALAAAVRDRLAPEDVIEIELAEGIALAYWRLRRAQQLEEALIEGRAEIAGASTLARSLLRRNNAIDALSLLLRYRNQALGELARLGRLLEQHRRPPSPLAEPPEPGAPTTPVLPPSETAAASTHRGKGQDRARPANDNRRGDGSSTTPGEAARSAVASDAACPLPRQDGATVEPAPPAPGSTFS